MSYDQMGKHQVLGQAATAATPSSVSQLDRTATFGAETSSGPAPIEIEKVVMVTPRKRKPRRSIGFAEDVESYEPKPGPLSKRIKAASVKAKQAAGPKATTKGKGKQKAWFTIVREKVEAELDRARADLAQSRQNTDLARKVVEDERAKLAAFKEERLELSMRMETQLAWKSAKITAVEEELRVVKEKARDRRQDRDAEASLLPISHKTESEYLQDLLALNQEISDVSRQLSPPKSRSDRDRLRALLTEQLWNKVFSVLVLGEDDADDEVLKSFHRGLQGNARTMFQGLLYASENVRLRDHGTMAEEICRRILEESPDLRSIEDIQGVVQIAVKLHWAMSSEVKQASVVYFPAGSPFDAKGMRGRYEEGQPIKQCLTFGFQGSEGTLEKALVII